MPARLLLAVLMLCHAAESAAVTVSGRNWQISIERIECAAAALAVGLLIRYLGPKGPVEAPLSYLTDAKGMDHAPRSLVWKAGAKQHAGWLSAGGLSNIQSEDIGELQLNFELRDAAADLRLAFGDIPAFALTRKRNTGCDGVLAPGQIQAARAARRGPAEKSTLRIYRAAYPCSASPGARTSCRWGRRRRSPMPTPGRTSSA